MADPGIRCPAVPRPPDASGTELNGQIVEIARGDVDRDLRSGFAGSGTALIRTCNMRAAQPAVSGGPQIVAVRRDHHAIADREIESRTGGEINRRLRLVIAGDLGAEDRIPRKAIAAGEIDQSLLDVLADEVAFGARTPEDAGQFFVTEATAILERAAAA